MNRRKNEEDKKVIWYPLTDGPGTSQPTLLWQNNIIAQVNSLPMLIIHVCTPIAAHKASFLDQVRRRMQVNPFSVTSHH